MRVARGFVPSAGEDGVVACDNGADGWVGGGQADAVFRLIEGGLHEGHVFGAGCALVGEVHGISAGWGFHRAGVRRWR